jgi:hypothetical protein
LGSVCISICDLGIGRTIKRSIAAFTKGFIIPEDTRIYFFLFRLIL